MPVLKVLGHRALDRLPALLLQREPGQERGGSGPERPRPPGDGWPRPTCPLTQGCFCGSAFLGLKKVEGDSKHLPGGQNQIMPSGLSEHSQVPKLSFYLWNREVKNTRTPTICNNHK